MNTDTEKSIIQRIRKLLTLANNSGATEAEAQNAMAMAQRLMIKYNISTASIGVNNTVETDIKQEFYMKRKTAQNPADREIVRILERFYNVKIFFHSGIEGYYLMMIGTPENIEIAKYVHGYLRNVFFKCWNEYKRTVDFGNERTYYCGLRMGLYGKLEQAERETKSEASDTDCQKYELAIVNNKEAIMRYVAKNIKYKTTRTPAYRNLDSYTAGRAKGATISINQAIKA